MIVRSCPSYIYNRLAAPQRQSEWVATTTMPPSSPNAEFNRGYATNAALLLKRGLEYDSTKNTPEDAVVARELIVSAVLYLIRSLPLTEMELQTLTGVPLKSATTTSENDAPESEMQVLFAMLCRVVARVARYCLPIARDMVQMILEWERRYKVSGKAGAGIVSMLDFARDRGLRDIGVRLAGIVLYGVQQGAKEWKL